MTPSLCETCQNLREVRTARSRFLLCELSVTSKAYPKYPPQPVVRCDGYEEVVEGKGAMTVHRLTLMPGTFAVCGLEPGDAIPPWATTGAISSITRTTNELSIVCDQSVVPERVRCEPDWRCLKLAGPIPFSTVGVLASLVTPLADAGISVFALSTFDTDYVLVKAEQFEKAVAALRWAGHKVE